MRQLSIGLVIALATGCGGEEEEPPTCDQAILHYETSGCAFYNQETGAQVWPGEIITACRELRETAPDSCQGAIDDWLFCLDDVPDEVDSNADCDCNAELARVQRCS